MSGKRTDSGIGFAVAAGSILTLGGFALAVAMSGRVASKAQTNAALGERPVPHPPLEFSDDDVEAAARMLASENGAGSPQLWTELIGTQIHARKPGQTLYARITAGSGYGPQGERSWPGQTRPVATEQEALPVHWLWAREVLAGLHRPQFAQAVAFFEPAQQDRAFAIAQRARAKRTQGVTLTKQEQRLLGYSKSAAAVRADWQKSLRHVGTIDGVEFYEMSRMNLERSEFASRERALTVGWPVSKSALTRVGDGVTESRVSTGEPHHGVDLFAPPGTEVRAARSGRVKRVMDGRNAKSEGARRAGLWIDVEVGTQIDRYLHLGEAKVVNGQRIKRGDVIGVIAEPHTSGTGKGPHLHFEVRAGDYDRQKKDYGEPVRPKFEVV